jgi:cbb3-type cytochrome oxidase subunit 3
MFIAGWIAGAIGVIWFGYWHEKRKEDNDERS